MDKTHPNFIPLKSKLTIPNLAGTVERERLYPVFSEVRNNRIITITAGAGYGKSTLVAQACRYLKINTVWYRLDASDGDFLTFIYYIIAGIQNVLSDFGVKTLTRIKATQSLKREKKSILTVLVTEMEEMVTGDLAIVLDDYHLIDDSSEMREILTFFTDHLPETIHLIIISRNVPDLNLSRFVARRESFDIGERELSFRPPEIDHLYKEAFNQTLSSKSLQTLYQQTEGWVSGLVLFNYAIGNKTGREIETHLPKITINRQVFSDYLEENIYASLDERVIDFLLKTSVLFQLDVEFCDQLLGIENSREILSILENKHLFTFPFDEKRESYYYHHLFQHFLQQKLKQTLDDRSRSDYLQRAAEICVESGKREEAIQYYLSAERYDEACGLLDSLGRQLVKEARTSLFVSLYERIPKPYISKHPWIQYSYGRALEFSAKLYEAIEAFKDAREMFHDRNMVKGVGLSLNRLFSNYYMIGDFIKAGDKLKELLTGVQGDRRLYVNVLGNLIFISAHLGRLDEADSYYKSAMNALKDSEEAHLHAWVYVNYGFRFHASGDVQEAKRFGEKSNKLSLRLKIDSLILFSYHLMGIANYYCGNFKEGFETALTGLKIARDTGIKDASHAWLLLDAGFCSSGRGDTAAAINYIQDALEICQELESPWSEAWAYHALQDAYLNDGNLFKAEKNARLAISTIEHMTLPLDDGLMKGALASVLLEKNDLDNAVILIREAEKTQAESRLNLCRVYLWYARYYWLKNEITPCLDKLGAALDLSENHQYDTWVVYEKRWIVPLLVRIYPEKKRQRYIDHLFTQLGPDAVETLKQLEKNKDKNIATSVKAILCELNKNLPSDLTAHCFGPFRLFRGNDEIPLESWSSEKAKMLLKYLIYHRGHGYIVKDKLLELLWPDEDPEVTNNRFHVAMTALRKALEPELPKGMPSSYIIRDGESYRVELSANGYVDIEAFDKEIESARNAEDGDAELEHYINAAALVKGDLFEEIQYEQWCIEAREVYREKLLNVLRRICDYYDRKNDHRQCIKYVKRYLAIDDYAEEMYRMLMMNYASTGQSSLVIKTYERCRQKIEEDLECPLSEETTSLYQELRG